jgi:hypothetical protein
VTGGCLTQESKHQHWVTEKVHLCSWIETEVNQKAEHFSFMQEAVSEYMINQPHGWKLACRRVGIVCNLLVCFSVQQVVRQAVFQVFNTQFSFELVSNVLLQQLLHT